MSSDFPFDQFFKKENLKKETNPKIQTPEYLAAKPASLDSLIRQSQNKAPKKNKIRATQGPSTKQIQLELLSAIKDHVGSQKFNAYFKDNIQINTTDDGKLKIETSTPFIKTMIETHYEHVINETITGILGNSCKFSLEVRADGPPTRDPTDEGLAQRVRTSKSLPESSRFSKKPKQYSGSFSPASTPPQISYTPSREDLLRQVDSAYLSHLNEKKSSPSGISQLLNRKKIFENFVVGPSNNMAYASAFAVSENPGNVYPSLYLHSDSGLGKTHLLNAIANRIISNFPKSNVCFTSARDFMTEMVNAMAARKITEFRKKYSKQTDILIIDDIHDLKDKTGTQNELFHIFNELYHNGKQLVFTSDKPPHEIDGLEQRIQTRLSWGLVIDIQKPDIETRMAILKKKAEEEDIFLPDDVIALITTTFKNNIRELEGTLIKLGAYSSVMDVNIDLEIAKEQLAPHLIDQDHGPSLLNIAQITSQYYEIPIPDLRSRSRSKQVTLARHVAMYLSQMHTNNTLHSIGDFFGKRDHSSVLHAVSKIKTKIKADKNFREEVNKIKKYL